MNEIQWKPSSRHPHILYWFWTPAILNGEQYCRDLEKISACSCYTMVVLSAREGMNFFDRSLRPHFEKAVARAHELGLKIVLQLWPEGFEIPCEIRAEEAAAVVTEHEAFVEGGEVQFSCKTRSVRNPAASPWLCSRPLSVRLFRKAGDGFYTPGTLRDITAQVEWRQTEGGLTLRCALPGYDGWTVSVMAAHYHAYGDLFSDFFLRSFGGLMEFYRDIPFDGMALDEFKNIALSVGDCCVRERLYGEAFARAYEAECGEPLRELLFAMRYAEEGNDGPRMAAINRYFDWLRRGPRRIEEWFAAKSREIFGPAAFRGLHNTYHNALQNDEIWATGCSWWELPRDYAQTDEDIAYPVRMGMACSCRESIHYDMFYCREAERFFRKAIEDAKFGTRIHYHAMNDWYWGVDAGGDSFLSKMNAVERKVELLNRFDGPMPALELLIVFGMPAVCNWYPDISARNRYDLNGRPDIMDRVKRLWQQGCRCALIPSSIADRGGVEILPEGFCYGGRRFRALLYLYPQYQEAGAAAFLRKALDSAHPVRVIGGASHDFDGRPLPREWTRRLREAELEEEDGVISAMGLTVQPMDRCLLEDGSVVMSDWESFASGVPKPFSLMFGGRCYEGAYTGCMAIACDEAGNLRKFACGGFTRLYRDGEILLESPEPADFFWEETACQE